MCWSGLLKKSAVVWAKSAVMNSKRQVQPLSGLVDSADAVGMQVALVADFKNATLL
jgi:hypothetical protein